MSQSSVQENKMGVMPIGKLLVNMALPMIISMIVQALYNVVDSIYVSQISESAVTALSLAFPVQNLQIGFAVGIGVGVNSLLSKSLGERNQENANRAAGNGLFLMLVAAAGFMIFGFVGVRPYFEIQSTVAERISHTARMEGHTYMPHQAWFGGKRCRTLPLVARLAGSAQWPQCP